MNAGDADSSRDKGNQNQGQAPTIRVNGSARQRGQQYGEAARDRIRLSVALYEDVFAAYTGWDWSRVRAECSPFGPAIECHDPTAMEEIRGIADGASLDELDVLAINVRSEIMFGARARGELSISGQPPGDGCSAVALLPLATADGHTLLGQNWDWIEGTRQTVVVVEATPDDAPAHVAIMEAGLLAKMALTANGIGIATNALISDLDRGRPAIPYHLCLRSLRHAPTMADALGVLQKGCRSSSANYLVAADGLAFDAEAWPGDFACMTVANPSDGRLFHTNHFVGPRFPHVDDGLGFMPDSPLRLQRIRTLLDEEDGLTREDMQAAFRDHTGHPHSVCTHPDRSQIPAHQEGTVLSVVMDVTERRLWLADGNPCSTPYRELDSSVLRQ